MENALPLQTPVLHDIHAIVLSTEEASLGVAELWSGNRQIGFTRVEDGELALRIAPGRDDVLLDTRALAAALAEANRRLALYGVEATR